MPQARENISASERLKKEKDYPVLKNEADRIESYSNLIYQISSELGFIIPTSRNEDDPLKRKYQPSLKYRGNLSQILLENALILLRLLK